MEIQQIQSLLFWSGGGVWIAFGLLKLASKKHPRVQEVFDWISVGGCVMMFFSGLVGILF